ncbi:hypothetical protein BCON_1146g00010 [Botryotinia convoluta]|uniref:Uncharacterized protein n=1 Tax=Botryotinia convoluta TaxID=54673 RepID=A0A4Z1HEW9_9HELO|nr:hypothetical protein BCON_1146g00010 [Botryotinia convoluta]
MGHLGPIFGVVFGLTCHKVYDGCKRQYPHSDALLLETCLWDKNSKEDVQHPLFRPSARLHELLDGWMGSGDTSKYFYFRDISLGSSDLLMCCAIPGYYVGKFLLRDVYGEEADPSGMAWIDEMGRILNVYKNKEPENIFIYIIEISVNVANEEYGQGSSVIEARRKKLRGHRRGRRE